MFPDRTSYSPINQKNSTRSTRINWAIALFWVAVHPLLLYLLYPMLGDAGNVVVIIAPVVGSYLLGWRIGHVFIVINIFVSAVVFKFLAGRGAEERPKMLLAFLVLSALCFGADRLKRFFIQRKALAAELDEAKKLEAIGRLAGGVAHDMNNNLNAILSSVYALKSEISSYGRDFKDLDTIVAACERAAQLTQNLLGFARKSNYRRQVFSVNGVIDGVLSILERTAGKNIVIRVTNKKEEQPLGVPCIEGDKAQIENAVMNLCLNSLDAMGEQGELTLLTFFDEKEVTICVSDTGIGMDNSVKERVFEPFYTTKEEGKGTGLGLSMVYGVVHAMKGRISLDTAPGKGTSVTLAFPLARVDACEKASTSTTERDTSDILRGRTLLLIDDEPLVLRSGVRMLKSIGCEVISALSGKEGIERFKTNYGRIDLVIVDLVMPGMDGVATLEEIFSIDATTPVVLVSGYTRESAKMAELKELGDRVRFLSKPYRPEQLIETAQDIFDVSVGVSAS